MALIECNECGKMISDRAEICPQCGSRKRIPYVQNRPVAQNRPNFQNRPSRVKPATKPLSMSEKLYFAFSGCFLLFVLIWIISFYVVGLLLHEPILTPYTVYLPVLGLYLVCFTIAATKLTSISKIIALALLSVGTISWLLWQVDQLAVTMSWIQRISLTIAFIIFIIKCDGWNIKIASVFQIIIRIFTAALSIYTYNKGYLPDDYYWILSVDQIASDVLYFLSAILFLIPIPKKQ